MRLFHIFLRFCCILFRNLVLFSWTRGNGLLSRFFASMSSLSVVFFIKFDLLASFWEFYPYNFISAFCIDFFLHLFIWVMNSSQAFFKVFSILQNFATNGDWKRAFFDTIPSRKVFFSFSFFSLCIMPLKATLNVWF